MSDTITPQKESPALEHLPPEIASIQDIGAETRNELSSLFEEAGNRTSEGENDLSSFDMGRGLNRFIETLKKPEYINKDFLFDLYNAFETLSGLYLKEEGNNQEEKFKEFLDLNPSYNESEESRASARNIIEMMNSSEENTSPALNEIKDNAAYLVAIFQNFSNNPMNRAIDLAHLSEAEFIFVDHYIDNDLSNSMNELIKTLNITDAEIANAQSLITENEE